MVLGHASALNNEAMHDAWPLSKNQRSYIYYICICCLLFINIFQNLYVCE